MMQKNKSILLVLFGTFIVRLVLYLWVNHQDSDRFMLHDSYGYAFIGTNLIHEGVYSQSETAPFYPDVFRPPLYPLFLSGIELLGGDLGLLMFFQILFSVLTCFFLMKSIDLIRNQRNSRFSFRAGILYAMDIPSMVMGNLVMTENLFTLLLTLFIFHGINWLKKEEKHYLIYAGIFLGLATLTRPISLYLPFFLIIYFIYLYRKGVVHPLLYLLVPILLLNGSWYLRNYLAYQHFFYSEIGNFNLLYFQAAEIYAAENEISLRSARNELYRQVQVSMKELPINDPVLFYEKSGELARSIMMEHPVMVIKNALTAHFNLFFRPLRGYLDYQLGNSDVFSEQEFFPEETIDNLKSEKAHPVTRILLYLQLLLAPGVFLLMLGGIYNGFNRKKELFFLLGILLYFTAVCSGPEIIDARFRVPLLPIMLMIASLGTFMIAERKKKIQA